MALNSTPRRFGVALGAVLAGITAGFVGFAGTAGAHTPDINAACEDGVTTLTVNLTKYNAKEDNTVKVTDGDEVLDEATFKTAYKNEWTVGGDVAHTFTVEVLAWDDKNGDRGWSFTKVEEVAKCVQPTTTTEPPTDTTTTTTETTPPTSTVTSTVPTTTETPTSSTVVPTTPAPPTTTTAEVEEAGLAETGASIALPLGIAGALLVGGVVALFIVRRRGKA